MPAEVGLGLIEFARAETSLFEAVFLEPMDLVSALGPRVVGPVGLTPYGLLVRSFDRMTEHGARVHERRTTRL